MTTGRPTYQQTLAHFQLHCLKMDCPDFQAETREHLGAAMIKEFRSGAKATVIDPYQKMLEEFCGEC